MKKYENMTHNQELRTVNRNGPVMIQMSNLGEEYFLKERKWKYRSNERIGGTFQQRGERHIPKKKSIGTKK